MKIYIKEGEKTIKIPLPTRLITSKIVIKLFAKQGLKYVNEDVKKYVDMIDFNALGDSMKLLRKYKGLKIVDISSADNEKVTIVL